MRIPGCVPTNLQAPTSARQDALLLPSLFLLNVFVFSKWPELGHVATKPWVPFAFLYGLLALVPLAWRDRAPVAVFITEWLLTVLAWPFMHLFTPVVGIPVALYAVSVHRSSKISLLALFSSCIPNGLAAAAASSGQETTVTNRIFVFVSTAVLLVIATVASWGHGRVARAIRRHLKHLESEREAMREEELLSTERRKIAREVHDTISRAVSVIVLWAAGAARYSDFTQIRQALAQIETSAREANDQLRRLLKLLNVNGPAGGAARTDELGPDSGLADPHTLIPKIPDSLMSVVAHVEGTPGNLDKSVHRVACRIVREGLTNVLKYGNEGSNPSLRLVWETQRIVIQIDNEIHPDAAQRRQMLSCGHGLVGLREDVDSVGGELCVGPHKTNGWRLRAALPVADASPTKPYVPPRDPPAPRPSTEDRKDQGKVSA